MKNPNIILISIDTLRSDHLSCYGYQRTTTPHIDKIAEKGVLFKNGYSTAVWTPPAHASMLTGYYPSQHKVIHQNKLNDDIPTVAQLLKKQGYHTAGFVNNSQVGELVGLSKGHDAFHEVWQGFSRKQVFRLGAHKIREFLGYSDDGAARTNQLAFNWLRKGWNREQPFYMFIHHIDAHNPLKAPRPFLFHFLSKELRSQVDMEKIWKVADNPLACFTDDIQLNEAELEALTCLYDEEIRYVDHIIGQLVTLLEEMKVFDDTLLILTADHGEHLGEHGMYSHVASLYEPIVHIPFILRYPRELSPQVREEYVQIVDIFPTISAACNSEASDSNLTGRNLLESNADGDPRFLFAEWEGRIPFFVKDRLNDSNRKRITEQFSNKQWMCRRDEFKLINDEHGNYELYNTTSDPNETENLNEKNPAIFDQLRDELEEWKSNADSTRPSDTYEYKDERLKKHLKALGYL